MLNLLGGGRWHDKWHLTRKTLWEWFHCSRSLGSVKWKQPQLPWRKRDYHMMCLGKEGHHKIQNLFITVSLMRWCWNQVSEVAFVRVLDTRKVWAGIFPFLKIFKNRRNITLLAILLSACKAHITFFSIFTASPLVQGLTVSCLSYCNSWPSLTASNPS